MSGGIRKQESSPTVETLPLPLLICKILIGFSFLYSSKGHQTDVNEVGRQEQADPDWVGGLGGHPAGEWQSAGQETGVQRRD